MSASYPRHWLTIFSLFEEMVDVVCRPYEYRPEYLDYTLPPRPEEVVQRTFLRNLNFIVGVELSYEKCNWNTNDLYLDIRPSCANRNFDANIQDAPIFGSGSRFIGII